jgi:hypothetical protein
MRPVKRLAIGALVAFELGVLGMILMPDVEPQYRAVYIDRTSECWPRVVSGAIEPGQHISFLKADAKGPSQHLLRCGWMRPEDTGTWSIGPESRLLLQVVASRPATIDLELLPFAERQRVTVTLNGGPLTEWVLRKDSPRGQTFEIPAVADGRLELAFHFPDAVAPRELGLSNDRRRLAIRLLSLTLRPQ